MTISLWWIGAGEVDHAALAHVRERLEAELAQAVETAARPGRPQGAYDARRGQWSSSLLMSWLAEQLPPGDGRVLGITDEDLFIPVLSYVFGEAQLNGRAAVVSVARLADARTGLWGGLRSRLGPGPRSRELFLSRLAKECLHELGHCFGLVHCDEPSCVMARSAGITYVDAKSATLCNKCRTRLNLASPEVATP